MVARVVTAVEAQYPHAEEGRVIAESVRRLIGDWGQ